MPAEHGLPRADIAVRWGYSSNIDVDCMVQKWIERVEVPSPRPLVHESIQKVSSINRRREDNIFPKHFLNGWWGQFIGYFVKDSHFAPIFSQCHWFFLNMEALVDASLSKNILLDRSIDKKIVQSLSIIRATWLEFRRRHYLNHSVVLLILSINFLHKLIEVSKFFHSRP